MRWRDREPATYYNDVLVRQDFVANPLGYGVAVQRRRWVRRARTAATVVVVLVLALLAACTSSPSAPPTTSASVVATVSSPAASPSPTGPAPLPRPNSVTPGGYWWAVDSSGPVGDEGLAAVQDWYQGATPAVWGRYLVGNYALRDGEIAWAAAHNIYLYLLIPDSNCSECNGGGDICGNDRTAAQAQADAAETLAAARAKNLPTGLRLYKDLEQVGSCRGEPTGEYVSTWYRAVEDSGYLVGFYGNSTAPDWDFPTAYCAALALDPEIGTDVDIDGNQPEPQIGAPRGTSGPLTAPDFAPLTPACAPPGSTGIWQYGESLDSDNYVDVDEVRPGLPGLLSPDGRVTPLPGAAG